jgi:hypothetical protein
LSCTEFKHVAAEHAQGCWFTYTMSKRISFSFCLTFLMMVRSPMMVRPGC